MFIWLYYSLFDFKSCHFPEPSSSLGLGSWLYWVKPALWSASALDYHFINNPWHCHIQMHFILCLLWIFMRIETFVQITPDKVLLMDFIQVKCNRGHTSNFSFLWLMFWVLLIWVQLPGSHNPPGGYLTDALEIMLLNCENSGINAAIFLAQMNRAKLFFKPAHRFMQKSTYHFIGKSIRQLFYHYILLGELTWVYYCVFKISIQI